MLGALYFEFILLRLMIYSAFMTGDELRKAREDLGMTQEQLAKTLGIASNTVARWERNERSIPPYLYLALQTVEREQEKGKSIRSRKAR
jgi:DNA-binding transcriptional regulator YiaG